MTSLADETSSWIWRGVIGGLVGGIVMAMWAMIFATMSGMSMWALVSVIASTWMGKAAAMHVTGNVIMIGLLTHMITSMILGGILGAIAGYWLRPHSKGLLVTEAIAFGLVVCAVSEYAMTPWASPLIATKMNPTAFAIGHMLFRAVTGLRLTGLLTRRSQAA